MIIGLGGRFCSGKSTIAKKLSKEYGIPIINFADKLKSIARDLFGIKIKDRTLLQKLGEKMREINKDVWVNYVLNKYKDKSFIIADIRFENEIKAIRNIGGYTFFIDRSTKTRLADYKKLYGKKPTKKQINHKSEKLDMRKFDCIIDNDQELDVSINYIKQYITRQDR